MGSRQSWLSNGQAVDFDTRIDEILVRYEPGSEVYNAINTGDGRSG
ncbi:hypothetical protein [Streptomyces lomondensis]|nr:hypothetical protein [Streptomyces lomondensis]MCF0076957.1 hypothetical protein [Streptomyces lomondensis]